MKTKRIISFLSAVTIACSVLPNMASAAVYIADGTEVDTAINNTAKQSAETAADDNGDVLPYLNESLPFEERAADLVSRMTLEEKVTQLGYSVPEIKRLGVGSYYYRGEALHGVARQGRATSFPSNLSMSNTWNKSLVLDEGNIIGDEARAKAAEKGTYNLSFWSPTINLSRDPRWGRNEKTYGEDVYMTTVMGANFVNGMKGDDDRYLKSIPTIKHFVANSSENDRNGGSMRVTEEVLRDYYGRTFEDIVKTADPTSAMTGYNAVTITRNGERLVDYISTTASKYTLTELLKDKWGFSGYVTGDCNALALLNHCKQYKYSLYPNQSLKEIPVEEVLSQGFINGLDIDCGTAAQEHIYAAVTEGYLDERILDKALVRIFTPRFRTGEFDKTSSYSSITKDDLETKENVSKSLEAAEQSWVLLKNNNNILPIKNTVSKIAVVGPLADECWLGDYSGVPTDTDTPYQGILEQVKKINPNAEVNFVGRIEDYTPLYTISDIKFVTSNGAERDIDLSKATVKGAEVEGNTLKNVTKALEVTIPSVDCRDVVSVKAKVSASGNMPGGVLHINYTGHQVAQLSVSGNSDGEVTGDYNGEGNYDDVSDITFSATANDTFSVDTYKNELDSADMIITYVGTTTDDSKEAKDRASIDMPASQSFVNDVAAAYPNKTVVAMCTVGQVDVSKFESNAQAILWTSYNGQKQGTALGEILTGAVNPSGKLTSTWYNPEDLKKQTMQCGHQGVSGSITDEYVNKYSVKTDEGNANFTVNDYNIKPADNYYGTGEHYPGRTYMYYDGTPVYKFGYGLSYTSFEYSNIKLDKNSVTTDDTINVSVDVKNTGNTKGAEAVQLYIKTPLSDGINRPKMQLKNFDRVELEPGETKTVTLPVKISDLHMFDEENTKTIVPVGKYEIIVGGGFESSDSLTADFNVTQEITKIAKAAVTPDGITLTGVSKNDGTASVPTNEIKTDIKAYMSNEEDVDLSKAKVTYTSSNDNIAKVSDNGTVTSSVDAGTATITASVEYNGVTVSDDFTVAVLLTDAVSDETLAQYKKQLKDEYDSLVRDAYTPENQAKIDDIYNETLKSMENAISIEDLAKITDDAVNALMDIPMQNLKKDINIVSNYALHENRIDYRNGGIPEYKDTQKGISGTVTKLNPYKIQLTAQDEYGVLDDSSIIWTITRLDDSSRKDAELDRKTGELTVYENGMYRINVRDPKNGVYGEEDIYVNLQIEAETTDNSDQCSIIDVKAGASGDASRGNTLGGTHTRWPQYKGIQTKGLKKIIVRYSLASSGVQDPLQSMNISTTKGTDGLLASAQLECTNSWSTWYTAEFDVNEKSFKASDVDENGLATIYIQPNFSNVDFIKLVYDEEPVVTPPPQYLEKTREVLAKNASDAFNTGTSKRLPRLGGDTVGYMYNDSAPDYANEVDKTSTMETGFAYNDVDLSNLSGLTVNFDRFYCTSDVKLYLDEVGGTLLASGTMTQAGETALTLSDYALNNAIEGKHKVFIGLHSDVTTSKYLANVGNLTVSYKELNPDYVEPTTAPTRPPKEPVTPEPTAPATSTPEPTAPAESKYVIDSVTVSDGKTNVAYTFSGDESKAAAKLITAVYNAENAVTAVKTSDISGSGSSDIEVNIPSDGYVKVFVWSDITGMQPMSAAVKAENKADAQVSESDMTAETNLVKLTVSANGDIKREMYNEVKSFNYNEENSSNYTFLKVDAWNNSNFTALVEDNETGDKKLLISSLGAIWKEAALRDFADSDIELTGNEKFCVNDYEIYGDQIYAASNDGIVIIITPCDKCYKLKKLGDFDITKIELNGDEFVMKGADGEEKQVPVTDLRQIEISAEKAIELANEGAYLIDVRTEEEYSEKNYEGSINIPIDNIENINEYPKDATLIFYCEKGGRAEKAVKYAQEQGYANVYNLGSVDKLLG